MSEQERQQLTLAWSLFGVFHCIDAWACSKAVSLLPASWLREALAACGGILCQPMEWLCTCAPRQPKAIPILLFLLNSALWGLGLTVGLRVARIRVTTTTVIAIVALFVVASVSVPAIAAVPNPSSFRPPALSYAPDDLFPPVTTEQMYEDYDHFTNIVHQVFPLIEVNRQVYGIDIPALLVQNRRKIARITQARDFVELIHDTMVCCRGSHFCIDKSVHPREFVKGFVTG